MSTLKYIMGTMILRLTVAGIGIAVHRAEQPIHPQSFEELTKLSDQQIADLDIASMNLLLPGAEMVAIGRRCGYPLCLVTCKGHLFCRLDNGKERFNIETACPGVDSNLCPVASILFRGRQTIC